MFFKNREADRIPLNDWFFRRLHLWTSDTPDDELLSDSWLVAHAKAWTSYHSGHSRDLEAEHRHRTGEVPK